MVTITWTEVSSWTVIENDGDGRTENWLNETSTIDVESVAGDKYESTSTICYFYYIRTDW